MHKTIGRSAQPNIGSKCFFPGALPPHPVEGGLLIPLKPPATPYYVIDVTKGGLHPSSNPSVN